MRHRVAGVLNQPPESIGRIAATGVTARHADDDHRIVVDRRGGGGASTGPRHPGELFVEVAGQRSGIGLVEYESRGQPQAGGQVQPVPQLDRGERVETQLAERPGRRHRLGRSETEHTGRPLPDQVEQDRWSPISRDVVQQVCFFACGRTPNGRPDEIAQQRRNRRRSGDQRRGVEAQRYYRRFRSGERRVEQRECAFRR